MEEEINLREIIEKLRKGKWFIVGITLTLLLVSILYSFFIADPVYKGTAKVSIHNVASVPEEVQPYINELTTPEIFEQTLKSTTVIEKVIEKEDLELRIGQLQSKLNVELPLEEQNAFITVSLEGTDKDTIKSIVDTAISFARKEMEQSIKDRLSLLEKEYQLKMDEENNQIDLAVNEYNDMQASEGLPSLILFQQNANDGQYILEANEDLLSELESLNKEDQVKYEKINGKIESLTTLYSFYSNKYNEVRSISTMNIIDISINVLGDTFVPSQPISPNKPLNIAISILLGLMIGVMVVFLRGYLVELKKNEND